MNDEGRATTTLTTLTTSMIPLSTLTGRRALSLLVILVASRWSSLKTTMADSSVTQTKPTKEIDLNAAIALTTTLVIPAGLTSIPAAVLMGQVVLSSSTIEAVSAGEAAPTTKLTTCSEKGKDEATMVHGSVDGDPCISIVNGGNGVDDMKGEGRR